MICGMELYFNGDPIYKAGSSSAGQTTGGEIYSTEETRIGTWIDGKPIYRMAFTGTTINGENKLLDNVDSLIDIKGFIALNDTYGNGKMFPCWSMSATDQINILISTNNSLILRAGSYEANKSFQVAIEYTKTTDTATISIPTSTSFPQESLKEMQ